MSNLSLGKVFIEIAVKKDKSLTDAPAEVDKLKNSSGGLMASLTSLKGIMAGLGLAAFIGFIKQSVAAFAEQERAVVLLNNALANQGNLTAGASRELQTFAGQMQLLTNVQDDAILSGQSFLAATGMTGDRIKEITPTILDFAVATGTDVVTAFQLMQKAADGNTATLSRYGIMLDEGLPKSEKFNAALEQMGERFGGAAQANAQSFGGSLSSIWTQMGEVMEATGQLIASIFQLGTDGGNALSVIAGWISRVADFISGDLVIAFSEFRAIQLDAFASVIEGSAMMMTALANLTSLVPGVSDALFNQAAAARETATGYRKNATAAREAADNLMLYGTTAPAAANADKELATNLTATAAARVQAAMQLKAHNDELSKVAASVGMALPAFQAMDAGFIASATATFQATEAAKRHKEALEGISNHLPMFQAMQASYRAEFPLTTEAQTAFAENMQITFEGIQTGVLEPWKVAYTGVGSLVAAQNSAMVASFQRWGTFTRTASQITADKLQADFDALLNSGTATAAELQAAWEKAEEAKRKASGDTGTSISNTWLGTTASIAGSLASLGGKWKKFALAEGAAAGALAILKAWSSAPWPGNLPAVAAATVATAVNLANIARQSFETGTPGLDFANFGSETPAMLHGKEAVIPQGGGHALAGEIAAAMGGTRGGGDMTSGAPSGSSTPINVTLEIDGRALGVLLIPSLEELTKTRRLRVHPNATGKEF